MREPRFTIAITDMVSWVRVYLGSGEPTGEVALFLSRRLAIAAAEGEQSYKKVNETKKTMARCKAKLTNPRLRQL